MPNRRAFLFAGLAGLAHSSTRRYRAAIIGHTGAGDYGHEWVTAWSKLPNVEVAAVADPVDAGRERALRRSGAGKGYKDYREMLRAEKPDLVSICTRWLDQRVPMFTAAAEAGAHILIEKPLARSLREADQMVQAAERNRIKVQVGHTARLSGFTRRAQQLLDAGEIGKLLEIRARGKEDRRAGGEDLMVLGTHIFDMMRQFAGDPKWVFAHVTQDGREIAPADARTPTEPVGPVAGNQIGAMFAFAGGLHGYFASVRNDQQGGPRFGVFFYGSKGVIYIPLTSVPSGPPLLLRSPAWVSDREPWQRIELPPGESETSREHANALMVADLLDAIEKNREPACGARDGRWTIEMVTGIYQSQMNGARVEFPLKDRRDPLRRQA